ncbi:unnamed protein product [Fraxinus pennsylvanica]|uniref:Uncharacterized protein n=1 Tax=Fraxinus pennsylvanica TaxID=56036 RepID=A0AAD1YQL9_9LAMI|nr:unnamed protein product [Fraxinus pennsylvanica]
MGEHNTENVPAKKRARVDSELRCDSPESKRVNSVGGESSEVELASTQAKQILDILDELDSEIGREEVIEDLDSVIRSFEEELHPNNNGSSPPEVLQLQPEAGEPQPDLGYLLEASDYELGLPPTVPHFQEEQADNELVDLPFAVNPESVKLETHIGIEDELITYDSFESGLGDGLFDCSEQTDILRRPESLSAL